MTNYFETPKLSNHPKDAKFVDDTPNVVVDEEGFRVATFRYYNEAQAFVRTINGIYPCACYCIEGEL